MALLKSLALQLLEAEQELQRKNSEECYALLQSWEAKQPVIAPTVALPAKTIREDTKPFGYNYSHLPSRTSKQRRWSEI